MIMLFLGSCTNDNSIVGSTEIVFVTLITQNEQLFLHNQGLGNCFAKIFVAIISIINNEFTLCITFNSNFL